MCGSSTARVIQHGAATCHWDGRSAPPPAGDRARRTHGRRERQPPEGRRSVERPPQSVVAPRLARWGHPPLFGGSDRVLRRRHQRREHLPAGRNRPCAVGSVVVIHARIVRDDAKDATAHARNSPPRGRFTLRRDFKARRHDCIWCRPSAPPARSAARNQQAPLPSCVSAGRACGMVRGQASREGEQVISDRAGTTSPSTTTPSPSSSSVRSFGLCLLGRERQEPDRALGRVPSRRTRDPAPDVASVRHVLVAEATTQRRLLVADHEQVDADRQCTRV